MGVVHAGNLGGRSCVDAQTASAEKIGLKLQFQTLTYAILSRIQDLSQFMHFLEGLWPNTLKTIFYGQ